MKKVSKNKTENIEERLSFSSIFIILAFFLFLLLLTIKLDVLIIKDQFNNEILETKLLKKNSYIGIIYTHSVEKTQVSEWYRIEKNNLILMEERFKSQGAGLPASSPYKFEKYKDGYRLYDINQPFESVIYRTGAIHANHILDIDGKEYPFSDFSEPRTAISFSVSKIPLFKLIMGVLK